MSNLEDLIIQDFNSFKKLTGINGEQAIEEYLEYNALYDININVIKKILEDYKQRNL